MENVITIKEETVLDVYQKASDEQKNVLKKLFGKDMFLSRDVTERIKTFEDACNELGWDNELVSEYETLINDEMVHSDETIASIKLKIIVEALNEGWKPTYDKREYRYYPLFAIFKKEEYDKLSEDEKKKFLATSFQCGTNGVFIYAYYGYNASNNYVHHSPKLVLKTRKLAEYCGKQFIGVWSGYLFS